MKKLISIITASMLLSTTAQADEQYNHFPSLKAPNTQVALCNLLTFNKKLNAIANQKDISVEDMVKVHELTYTLENAVQRLQKDLELIAVNLEKVHKASEVMDKSTVKNSGKTYLNATGLITAAANCK